MYIEMGMRIAKNECTKEIWASCLNKFTEIKNVEETQTL